MEAPSTLATYPKTSRTVIVTGTTKLTVPTTTRHIAALCISQLQSCIYCKISNELVYAPVQCSEDNISQGTNSLNDRQCPTFFTIFFFNGNDLCFHDQCQTFQKGFPECYPLA